MTKTCDNCENAIIEEVKEESFAMQLLKDYSKQAKRWFIIAITILVMWLVTIAGFIWYLNQFETVDEIITVDSNDAGDANYIGNDGDIYNGESASGTAETN